MKRIQNRIAESRYALPMAAVLAVGVCLCAGLVSQCLWAQFGLLALGTYVMVLMNNLHALMRIYSRMVSCTFLVLSLAAIFLLGDVRSGIVAVGYAAFYTILFHAYQDKGATGTVFYAFVCLGIASLAAVKVLWLLPLLWLLMATKILAMSGRTFMASVLGVVAPYWFALCYCAYTGALPILGAHLAGLQTFDPLADYASIPLCCTLTIAFVIVVGIIGAAHFLATSYNDKIRTRMLFEFMVYAQLVLSLLIVLQPQLYVMLLPMLIVNTAPLAAHFAALSRSRLSNVVFLSLMVLTAALVIYNLIVCSPIS